MDKKTTGLLEKIRPYALKAGRMAAKPLLQFYYVMTDSGTSTMDKALIYAAIIYTVSPVSLIPASVHRILGVMDEGVAVLYVYKKIKGKITPQIQEKVDSTLDEWFGDIYEVMA